ncbi:MAG TPA: MFS transporter [Myxococcota bacterium]|jgi:ACS family tartrate transporter-like MFS transporter|nr:MFS transporter [Myxococcota bacterium]
MSIGTRTIRRVQLRLLPFLFLLYVIAFLDRINIGFAALTMNAELGIGSEEFGFVAGIFFFGYFAFEVPSNLLLHRVGARVWIARILLVWGAVAVLTGFAKNAQQLSIARFVLGLAEAGYFPGIVLYLTYWFRQRERARAIALFLVGLPVASLVGGPISGLILDHVRWLGLSSWRWLLILEGMPAVVCGVLTYFVLPDRPADARFLGADEKAWLVAELEREERETLAHRRFSVLETLSSRRVWHMAAIHFGLTIGLYTLSFWLPTVVKSLSAEYSNSAVGVLVTVPNLVGLIAMVLVSHSSDRRLERRWHAAVSLALGGVALLLFATNPSPLYVLALLSLLAVGAYSYLGPFWAIPGEFLTGFSAAAGIALINAVGNLGGLVGPLAIGAARRATGDALGALAIAGIPMLASAVLALLLPKPAREPATDRAPRRAA